jgi:peroxiredoxin Q/BCP
VAQAPDVGDRAPDFELPSTQGPVRLSDRLAKSAVLLVFYPGDDTPVCTRQLCDYRDHLGGFRDLGVDVVAVNPQPLASHERFAEKHDLPFPLCADEDKSVCKAFDAVGLLGMTKRALYLVGRDGTVRYRKVDLPVFRRTAEELREVIDSLDLEAT